MTNLPVEVTQAARDAAASIHPQYFNTCSARAANMAETEAIKNGHMDDHENVQAFARFERDIIASQSHSLPGDVDTDDLLDLIDEAIGESGDEEWTPRDAARHVIGALEHAGLVVTPRAALTPSALSGDAGDDGDELIEAVEHLEAVLFSDPGEKMRAAIGAARAWWLKRDARKEAAHQGAGEP